MPRPKGDVTVSTQYVCPRCGYKTAHGTNMKNHCNAKRMCPPTVNDVERPAPERVMTCKVKERVATDNDAADITLAASRGCDGGSDSALLARITDLEEKNAHLQRVVESQLVARSEIMEIQRATQHLIEFQRSTQSQLVELQRAMNRTIESGCVSVPTMTINNTSHLTINVRDFGKEDTSYISDERIHELVGKCTEGLITFIKELYFNVEQPQNSTIRIKSVKQDMSSMRRDGRWVIVRTHECVDKAVLNSRKLFFSRLPEDFSLQLHDTNPIMSEWHMRTMSKHLSVWRPCKDALKCALVERYDEERQLLLQQRDT